MHNRQFIFLMAYLMLIIAHATYAVPLPQVTPPVPNNVDALNQDLASTITSYISNAFDTFLRPFNAFMPPFFNNGAGSNNATAIQPAPATPPASNTAAGVLRRRDLASSITDAISNTFDTFVRPFDSFVRPFFGVNENEATREPPRSPSTATKTSGPKRINVINQCSHAIHVGYQTNGGGAPQVLPFVGQGQSTELQFPSVWAGRVWARPSCNGDDCSRVASAKDPASLAEFKFHDVNNRAETEAGVIADYYDVSFVDGFNLPIQIEPVFGGVNQDGFYCARTSCAELPSCPKDLQVLNAQGEFVGCESACSRYGTEQLCCTGEYSTAETCLSSMNPFATVVERQCPNAYSYAYDDPTSMFTCDQTMTYQVIFCPGS